MPLHLDSLTEDSSPDILAWIVQHELQAIDDAFAQKGKKYFLGSTPLRDAKTGENIGKYVFTIFSNLAEKRNEVLDLDLVLSSNEPAELALIAKLPESSDSNEYYEAVVADTERHLHVETVNRYALEYDITGTRQKVYASAFPFQLTIFDDEAAFNSFWGFGESRIKVANTDFTVNGLDAAFIAPGGLFDKVKSENSTPWSIVIGTIKAFRNVTIAFGDREFEAYVVTLKTALGDLPTLVGKEVFDTRNIAVGKIVGMYACVKINFIKDNYPKPENQPVSPKEPVEEKRRGFRLFGKKK